MYDLDKILSRTAGLCHVCRKQLARRNYGCFGERGAWEVDHSIPRIRGGTDHGNNLKPICIHCNRSKQDRSTRTARAQHGHTRAPLSKSQLERSRKRNAVAGGTIGAAIGAACGGPPGAWLGGALGAAIGYEADPE